MAKFSVGFEVISKKKDLQSEMAHFSPDFEVIFKKKRSLIFHKLICQCHFDEPYEAHWVLPWALSSPWAP